MHLAAGWAISHLALILWICANDTTSLIQEGLTVVRTSPPTVPLNDPAPEAKKAKAGLVEYCATYSRCAGIEASYSFFAPNVPDSYALVFELHLASGETEYEFNKDSHREGKLRLASLMDAISTSKAAEVRKLIIRLLTNDMYQRHPDVVRIRSMFVRLANTELGTELANEPHRYEVLYSYDFDPSAHEAESR
jgi:hypothetical protein